METLVVIKFVLKLETIFFTLVVEFVLLVLFSFWSNFNVLSFINDIITVFYGRKY